MNVHCKPIHAVTGLSVQTQLVATAAPVCLDLMVMDTIASVHAQSYKYSFPFFYMYMYNQAHRIDEMSKMFVNVK